MINTYCAHCNTRYHPSELENGRCPNCYIDLQKDGSRNNGGSTDYYKFDKEWKECADIIEARAMNYNQGNIFKSAFCFNIGRHDGTDEKRELNKIIYFAQRELKRIAKDKR